MDRMLTPEEALQLVLDRVSILGVEHVSLLDALGRVLAEQVHARYDNPPHDNSAMDGYALRFADVRGATAAAPVALQVVEDIPAGRVPTRALGPGQASRIMTGALVPSGADAVVPVEDTRPAEDRVQILDPNEKGANIRRRGEDMQAGTPVLSAGALCGPGELGLLAALQRSFVPVYRRPRIAILSTGDELVEIDQPLEPGKIVNSNTYALAALCRAHGGEPTLLPAARDDEAHIRRAVQEALAADFVLSSGGVSVGEYDYVKKVLSDLGAEQIFWRVSMKPGKPLYFCALGEALYFGLPGNPVSSMMSFLQFVRPAIRRASGHAPADCPLPEAVALMEHPVSNEGDRRQYLRARLRFAGGRLHASVAGGQGSHMLTSMVGANGFVVLDPQVRVEEGCEAKVQIVGEVFRAHSNPKEPA